MGGTVATMFAARSPELVERLVLVAPALPARRRRPPDLDPKTLRQFAPFVVRPVGGFMARRRLRKLTVDELWREGMEFVHGDPSRVDPATEKILLDHFAQTINEPSRLRSYTTAAASLVGALLWRRELLRAIDAVTARTLVVRGDADRLVADSVVEHVQDRRPDWDVTTLEGVGHVPILEVPERYVALVTDWMALGSEAAAAGSVVAGEDRLTPRDVVGGGAPIDGETTGGGTPGRGAP